MSDMDFKKLVSKGEEAVNRGDTVSALSFFERASSLQDTPLCRSYLAFCIAKERGQYKKAISLCEEAIKEEPAKPVLYLNLGRIYLLLHQKDEAMRVFREGLHFEEDKHLVDELIKLGMRKPLIFPFLKRSNPINRYLGLLLTRLGLR